MAAKVLFFHTGSSTFVSKDISILQESGTVVPFSFTARSKAATPVLFIRQLFFLLRHLPSTVLSVSQFAGYHSFLPALFGRLTGKPMLIIAGGTDCHAFPVIGYGQLRKGLIGVFTRWSFRLCKHIAPKHESLWHCDYTYDSSEPASQGIMAHMSNLRTSHTVIPNGYDAASWTAEATVERLPRTFITVSSGFQFPFQRQLKGIDLVIEAAKRLPDCSFTILGVPPGQVWSGIPSNLKLLPPGDHRALVSAFSSHTYYLQLSMAEGFPNALCEAMLCGCIPIGSDVFSIPEIIGRNGYILRHRDVEELVQLLNAVVKSSSEGLGTAARDSIVHRFPLLRRKNELLTLCRNLTKKG